MPSIVSGAPGARTFRLLDGFGLVWLRRCRSRGNAVEAVSGGLPGPRGEFGELAVRPAADETGQHVGEPAFRVHAVQLAGFTRRERPQGTYDA